MKLHGTDRFGRTAVLDLQRGDCIKFNYPLHGLTGNTLAARAGIVEDVDNGVVTIAYDKESRETYGNSYSSFTPHKIRQLQAL